MIERAWEKKIEPITVRISTAVRITGLSRSRITVHGTAFEKAAAEGGSAQVSRPTAPGLSNRSRPMSGRRSPSWNAPS